jgi:hypothetical protein
MKELLHSAVVIYGTGNVFLWLSLGAGRAYISINIHKSDLHHVYFLSHLTQQSVAKMRILHGAQTGNICITNYTCAFCAWSSARRANVLLKSGHQGRIAQNARAAGRGVVYILYAVFPTAAFLRTHNTH